jgi:hypothetical protein
LGRAQHESGGTDPLHRKKSAGVYPRYPAAVGAIIERAQKWDGR